MRLANGEAADSIAWKIQIEKLARAFAPQVLKRRALHDAELPLVEIAVSAGAFLKMVARAARPGSGALEGGFGYFTRRGRLNAFIQDHGDVRPQGELNLGGFFWGEEMLRAVEMRAEAYPFIGHFSQFGEAEDLIAAGIREDGTRPRHELMQAAELADQLVAGAQIKMIGIGEDDFRAEFFERFIAQAFDGGLRADRQEERRLHHAVRSSEAAAARPERISFQDFKRKTHKPSLSEENPSHHGEE